MIDPTKDPKNYLLGVFYFNKDDKRIFPPKRLKAMGWTINFANPISIGALLLLLLIAQQIAQYIKTNFSG